MKKPPFASKGPKPTNHTPKRGGETRGDVHGLVKHEASGDGEIQLDNHEADTPDKVRAKDLDNAASGEGMNLDFPNTALQDHYQPISPMRMRALGIASKR